jgi:UDP-N-acetylglucosamine--N-acetylmuramyl-(pentapeptide) pyrophosphoryl-undecaprenol N-acetylglucosamine transferase
MRIAFVGGGTGGHFYPLIATAEALRTTNVPVDLIYIGPVPYNQDELTASNIKFVYCPAGKLRRYFSVQNFLDFFRTGAGFFVALYKLFIWYPDVVFSKGGYTSVPVLLAARFYRIPVVIHESDSKAGRASLLAKKFARYIGIAYEEVASSFPPEKTALVGIPIRSIIKQIDPNPFQSLGIPSNVPLIYVTGGSLGAERINNLILRSLKTLLPQYQIFHQTGASLESSVIQTAQALISDQALLSRYYVRGSVDARTVSTLYDAAALVISRAGSTTLFEIAMHGKPSIIIPIPEEISHDQRTNAYAYARTGAASVLEEGNLTDNLLIAEIQSIMSDQAKYYSMSAAARSFSKPNASLAMAQVLISIGNEHY